MIPIQSINETHILVLDTTTDKTHLKQRAEFSENNESNEPLLTFDSNLKCTDKDGKHVARITTDINRNLVVKNELGIVTEPVSMLEYQSIYTVEAEFCKKWLELRKVTC